MLRKNEPIKKWVEAGEAFLKSELVRTYVADAEVKWRHAMRDDDGGALLIARAFEQVNSAQKKQSELGRTNAETGRCWPIFGLSSVVNPDSNITVMRRIATAEQVVRWLHSDPSSVYWQMGRLNRHFVSTRVTCFHWPTLRKFRSGDGQTPDDSEVRFRPNCGRSFRYGGASAAPNRWKKHVGRSL